jgi:hypothetical protein
VDAETSCRGRQIFPFNSEEEHMTDIHNYDSIQVFIGVDVGKGAHHASP